MNQRVRALGQFVSNLSKKDQRDLTKLSRTANIPGSFQNFVSTRINPRTNKPLTVLNDNQKQFVANILNVPVDKVGKYGNIKGKRIIPTEETRLNQSEAAKIAREEGKGLNLITPNLLKQQAAANNPSLVAAGLEGPMKAAIAKISPQLRDDTGIVKGALSQYRSDLGYYDLTKAQQEAMLNPTNVKKYVDTAIQYKPQLNKAVNQIASYRTDKNQPTKELVDLMTKYANLTGSNPEYHKQRALTFGHPSGIAANLDHYLRTGDQTAKMLSRDPKFLTKMQAEIGPLNIGKEKLDRGILAALRNTENKVTKEGLAQMRKLYDMSGLQSILPGQIYNKMYLGMNNPELQMQFLRNAINKSSKPFGKLTQRDVQNIMFGNKTISDFGFFRGGIASLLE
jgi:hypothetical protein